MQDETQRLQPPPRVPEPTAPTEDGGPPRPPLSVGPSELDDRPTPRGFDSPRAERTSKVSPEASTARPVAEVVESPLPSPPPGEGPSRVVVSVAHAETVAPEVPSSQPIDNAPLLDAPLDPVYLPLALSVGAGFKFGCGFMLAVGIAALVLFLTFSVVFFVASLMGIPLPIVGSP